MKAKRRYVAQNVFHARTLPGLGNARITRLAAPGDAIPLRDVRHASARGERDALGTRTQAALRRATPAG